MSSNKFDPYEKKEKRGLRIHVGQFREFIPFDDEIERSVDLFFDNLQEERTGNEYQIHFPSLHLLGITLNKILGTNLNPIPIPKHLSL